MDARGNAGRDLKNNEPVGRISDSVIRRYSRRVGGLRLRLNPPYGLCGHTGELAVPGLRDREVNVPSLRRDPSLADRSLIRTARSIRSQGLLPQIPKVDVRGNAGQDLKNNEPLGRISDSVIRRYGGRVGGLRLRLNPPYGLSP